MNEVERAEAREKKAIERGKFEGHIWAMVKEAMNHIRNGNIQIAYDILEHIDVQFKESVKVDDHEYN